MGFSRRKEYRLCKWCVHVNGADTRHSVMFVPPMLSFTLAQATKACQASTGNGGAVDSVAWGACASGIALACGGTRRPRVRQLAASALQPHALARQGGSRSCSAVKVAPHSYPNRSRSRRLPHCRDAIQSLALVDLASCAGSAYRGRQVLSPPPGEIQRSRPRFCLTRAHGMGFSPEHSRRLTSSMSQ